jgi:8-oxo-dGTP pyrophosphatase MutT (NUDIX family)
MEHSMFTRLAHFIERHQLLHRTALRIWRHFPPRLAGFMKMLLTTRWTVGAVAVILDDKTNPTEVLLVEHSYRIKGTWGLPGGALESGLASPRRARARREDNVLESALRREIFEELGIEIEILRLLHIDAIPYVPEEPGPYRLDFYYQCLPKQGITALREGLASGRVEARSPEIKNIRFVSLSSLSEYDMYSSDATLLGENWSKLTPKLRSDLAT